MIYDKYGCNDDAQYEEEQERIKEEVLQNYSTEIRERVEEVQDEEETQKQWEAITTLYNVKNYYDGVREWEQLSQDDKLAYYKSFLEPIDSDDFPLQRQVFIFTNIIKMDFVKMEAYKIIDVVLSYSESSDDAEAFKINYLIPKKHYKEYIDRLYQETDTKSLHIPIENSTEYLQELLEIWYLHKQDFSPYKISRDLLPYESGVSYEPKQIERKLTVIRTLLH
jgi:hypothetical protein